MSDTNDQYAGTFLALFLIEIDGVEIGRFTELSGLQIDVATEDYEEGGENGFVHKLPGRMTWPNLVLKRGITKEDVFLKWLHETVGDGMARRKGKARRSTLAVTLLSSKGGRLRSWSFVDALPIRWTGPNFSSSSTEAPTEELEIAHHGFRVA